MAGYKGHVVGAIILNGVYVAALSTAPNETIAVARQILSDYQTMVGFFVVAVLFGLFPDIDTNSKGQNLFYGTAIVADIALIASGHIEAAAYLGLLAMTPIVGKHRGWTHSYWAMFLVPSPILLVPYLNNETILPTSFMFYGAAVIGYFSHLLLDGEVIRSFRIKSSWGR